MVSTQKIVFIGSSGVGKTALVSGMSAVHSEGATGELALSSVSPTIGVDFVTLYNVGASGFNVQLWDTAGMERYAALTTVYLRNAAAIVLVYDVTRAATFDELVTKWATLAHEVADLARQQQRPRPLIFVVGNKVDLMAGAGPTSVIERSFAASIGAEMHVLTTATLASSIRAIFLEGICNNLFVTLTARATLPRRRNAVTIVEDNALQFEYSSDQKEIAQATGHCSC